MPYFVPIPGVVEARQITRENLASVAEWAGALQVSVAELPVWILLDRPLRKAYAGEWVVRMRDGHVLVLPNRDFLESYAPFDPQPVHNAS